MAEDDLPVSKLFFDSFSGRVADVERRVQALSVELEKLRVSIERMQVSDLVLLERIQKGEKVVRESLESIEEMVEGLSVTILERPESDEPAHAHESRAHVVQGRPAPTERPVAAGILSGLNTSTELQVVSLLGEEGSKTAPEIGRVLGRSREHTARLLKKLYDGGYVKRDQARIPFRYSLVERVRASLRKEEKREGQETGATALPQS